jgi:hypothetical protein
MVSNKIVCALSLLASITGATVSANPSKVPHTHSTPARVSTNPRPELHTSDYWYRHPVKNDFFSSYVIVDPDGWRRLPDPQHYWYHQKITRTEFDRRVAESTITLGEQESLIDKPAPF